MSLRMVLDRIAYEFSPDTTGPCNSYSARGNVPTCCLVKLFAPWRLCDFALG